MHGVTLSSLFQSGSLSEARPLCGQPLPRASLYISAPRAATVSAETSKQLHIERMTLKNALRRKMYVLRYHKWRQHDCCPPVASQELISYFRVLGIF